MVLEPNVRVLAAKMREAINGPGKKGSHIRPTVSVVDMKHPQAPEPIIVRSFPRQPHGASRPRRMEALNGHVVAVGTATSKERPVEVESQRP